MAADVLEIMTLLVITLANKLVLLFYIHLMLQYKMLQCKLTPASNA